MSDLGLKDDDLGMNSPLMWLRGDGGNHGIQFRGIGVSPWMQPRFDASVLGMQNDMYQAMAAAAFQEMRALDPSKQASTSLLQFQQTQNLPNHSVSLMQPQMMQQSQHQPSFIGTTHESQQQSQSQSQSQSQTQNQSHFLQQQLQNQHSFGNGNQPQQQSLQQQQLVDNRQTTSAVTAMTQFAQASQPQTQSLQAIPSLCHQQSFSDSTGNPVTSPIVSPMQSLMGSYPQDESPHLLNLPRNNTLITSDWPPAKRVAVESLLPSGNSQCVPQLDQLVVPQSTVSQNSMLLPPLPGRECQMDQEGGTDSQNRVLFGISIESSPLLMQNGTSSHRGVGNDNDSTSIALSASNYMSTTGNDFSLNTSMAPSTCIEQSGFLQPHDVGQVNIPNGTFVKVCPSFGSEIVSEFFIHINFLSSFSATKGHKIFFPTLQYLMTLL